MVVLDLFWISVDGVLVYIGKSSREDLLWCLKGLVSETMHLCFPQRILRQQTCLDKELLRRLKASAFENKELMSQCKYELKVIHL